VIDVNDDSNNDNYDDNNEKDNNKNNSYSVQPVFGMGLGWAVRGALAY
jgi:hypothetical protein